MKNRVQWVALCVAVVIGSGCVVVDSQPTGSSSSYQHTSQDARPTCDELAEIADSLDVLADAWANDTTIYEGSVVDNQLGDVVTALEHVAQVEGDAALAGSVRQMSWGYDNFDGNAFSVGLEATIMSFDNLYDRDCY